MKVSQLIESLCFSMVLFILSSAVSVQAVGVDMDGYFRVRYNSHYNLDLDRDIKPNMRNYADFRFRLNPEFLITNKIRVQTSFNIADAAFGDAPFRGMPYSNPAQANDILLNEGGASNIGQTLTSDSMTSWVYGGASAPDAATSTGDLRAVQMRRAWVEWESAYGTFKAGRMPYQFGLGILGNAGDDVDQEIGSTRDRILFETGLGNYYLIPGIGWQYEGILDRGVDDYYEYFFILGRRVESQEIAFYISYLAQDKAVSTATNGSFQNAGTSYWVLDLFAHNRFHFADIGVEAVLYAGDFLDKSLFAVNAAARADWYLIDRMHFLTEVGFSSGTSAADVANQDIKSFAFNRDFNVSMILFEEALPGGPQLNADGRPTAPHSGAISNAIFARAKLGYEFADFFQAYINVLAPYAAKKAPQSAGRFYGFEYNLITLWPFDQYVSGELSFAHFIPGSFFDTVSQSHSSLMLRAGMNIAF